MLSFMESSSYIIQNKDILEGEKGFLHTGISHSTSGKFALRETSSHCELCKKKKICNFWQKLKKHRIS